MRMCYATPEWQTCDSLSRTYEVQAGSRKSPRMIALSSWTKRHVLLPTLVLVASLLASGVSHATPMIPTTLTVVGPSAPVALGQRYSAEVLIDGADNLGSFEFRLVFDPTVTSTSVEEVRLAGFLGNTGRDLGELRLASPSAGGTGLTYGAYSFGMPAGASGSGLLASVELTAIAAGESSLELEDVVITDVAGNQQDVETTGGRVRVVDEEPPPSQTLFLPVLLRR